MQWLIVKIYWIIITGFEVHVEICLSDKKGRHEILEIHTKGIRENKRLATDVDLWDIADKTRNYSGAELEGLVKCTISIALSTLIENNKITTDTEMNNKFYMKQRAK